MTKEMELILKWFDANQDWLNSIQNEARIMAKDKEALSKIEITESKVTIEEIEELIAEYGDACAEWQAFIDEQFEDFNPEGLKNNVTNSFNKLLEAIKEYKGSNKPTE